MDSRAPGPSAPTLAQPQNGHFVELADLLIDCEPAISMNYPALQALCADYKDKEFGEGRIAELFVKLGNSVCAAEDKSRAASGSAALFFQATKPSKDSWVRVCVVDVKVGGASVASTVFTGECKGWNVDNLARCFRELFGKINVQSSRV